MPTYFCFAIFFLGGVIHFVSFCHLCGSYYSWQGTCILPRLHELFNTWKRMAPALAFRMKPNNSMQIRTVTSINCGGGGQPTSISQWIWMNSKNIFFLGLHALEYHIHFTRHNFKNPAKNAQAWLTMLYQFLFLSLFGIPFCKTWSFEISSMLFFQIHFVVTGGVGTQYPFYIFVCPCCRAHFPTKRTVQPWKVRKGI